VRVKPVKQGDLCVVEIDLPLPPVERKDRLRRFRWIVPEKHPHGVPEAHYLHHLTVEARLAQKRVWLQELAGVEEFDAGIRHEHRHRGMVAREESFKQVLAWPRSQRWTCTE